MGVRDHVWRSFETTQYGRLANPRSVAEPIEAHRSRQTRRGQVFASPRVSEPSLAALVGPLPAQAVTGVSRPIGF